MFASMLKDFAAEEQEWEGLTGVQFFITQYIPVTILPLHEYYLLTQIVDKQFNAKSTFCSQTVLKINARAWEAI